MRLHHGLPRSAATTYKTYVSCQNYQDLLLNVARVGDRLRLTINIKYHNQWLTSYMAGTF